MAIRTRVWIERYGGCKSLAEIIKAAGGGLVANSVTSPKPKSRVNDTGNEVGLAELYAKHSDALSQIKELNKKIYRRDKRISELKSRIIELEELFAK